MFDISEYGIFHGGTPAVVTPAARCAELLAAARGALAELARLVSDGVFTEVPDLAVGEFVSDLSRVVEDASAVRSAALAVVDRSGVARGQGYVSTAAWLRDRTGLDARTCRDQIRTARLLSDSYQATHDAWLSGEITTAHAATLVRGVHTAMKAVDPTLRADARRQSEATLIELSREFSVDHTIAACKRIRAAVDPDGLRASALELEGKEFFKLTPVADGYLASGWFTHLNGTKLASILEGRRNAKYHAGQLSTRQDNDFGDSPEAHNDCVVRDEAGDRIYPDEQSARRIYEQNAIVLNEIADELLNGGHAGVIGGERPHVEITVNLADLADQTGHGELTLIGAQNPARFTPLSIEQIREHACDAHVRRVVLKTPTPIRHSDAEPDDEYERGHRHRLIEWLMRAPSEIIDYGREQCIVPSGLRRILARRDGGCIYPGCARPPQHTHAHHVQHWADAGETTLANLASLCSTHHHAVHESDVQLTPAPGKHPNQPGYWTIAASPGGSRGT